MRNRMLVLIGALALVAGCHCGGGGADRTDATGAGPDGAAPGADGAAPGVDGAAPADGGAIASDSAPAAALVDCEGTTCAPTDECCVVVAGGPPAASCVPAGSCAGAVFSCDGSEDCGGVDAVCCGTSAGLGGGSAGPSACMTGAMCEVLFCHTAADCQGGNCLDNPAGPGRYCS
jgi:hypothetical protein